MNILCFGDSNTYGYKPDGTGRFDTDTRWTSLLQKKLGADHRVIEEGLCGRTTVFQDDLREGRRGLDLIGVTMEMHNPYRSPYRYARNQRLQNKIQCVRRNHCQRIGSSHPKSPKKRFPAF